MMAMLRFFRNEASGHLQTIAGALVRKVGSVPWRRERLELQDGDFLDLDHSEPNQESADRVLIVHGLGGSSEAPYVRGLAHVLIGHGFAVTAMNLRGAAGPNRLARTYHAGDTADIARVAEHLRARSRGLGAVGFSLGGNALLKLMGERGSEAPFVAAASVCAPLDLEQTSKRLNQGLSRGYEQYLLLALKRALWKKRQLVAGHLDLRAAMGASSFAAWDERVTAPLHGFAGAKDYWARSSARGFISKIERPTLVLHALDDPFMPHTVLPDPATVPPAVTVEALSWGGHVGFLTGITGPSYADARVTDFLTGKLRGR